MSLYIHTIRKLLTVSLTEDLCACSGVGLGETRRAAWLIAAAYSGGQSGEVVWDASISFGFLGVCSFSGVSVGLRKYDCSFVLEISPLIAARFLRTAAHSPFRPRPP